MRSVNAEKLIEFLEALIKDAKKNFFLILDNLRVHHSKPVKAWAVERQDKIELFYLPSYSPELNPEERCGATCTEDLLRYGKPMILDPDKAGKPAIFMTHPSRRKYTQWQHSHPLEGSAGGALMRQHIRPHKQQLASFGR